MTPNCKLVVLILSFSWLEGIYAAAFSNVVVQRGPVEYINYNPSAFSFTKSQLAQLSSSPLEQVVSIPAVSPCVAPCVIPSQPISALASLPATANAKIVGYRTSLPNVPILLANKDEATGYQYAYAVFDEQTGDKKTQSEQSDGSVVQGQYSFVQPDGFRRVVVYTADDTKGFNAVVRNISPEQEHPVEESLEVNKESKPVVLPCPENKNEHLTNDQVNEEISVEATKGVEQMDDKKIEEKSAEKSIEKVEEHAQEEPQPQSEPTGFNTNIPNSIISYNDVINCLQAKLQGTKNVVSPLTYVLFPSSRSPC
ncbi:uncharacterized protein LOC113393341 isoform X1 [Vanessa tameamea]|uniref:Uncharacterized protein LOC113393341 isoform X1 n=1 Tax=Vanessa tameamea TaxID=334116 RepID=A0A8B8HMP8_VANTA